MLTNLPLILFALTLLSGAAWMFDKAYLARGKTSLARAAEYDDSVTAGARAFAWIATVASLFPVLAVVFVFRSFMFEPFRIPSLSMSPTLLVGDFVLVNKFVYGIRLPIIDRKIISIREPKPGDVMVFRHPAQPQVDLIKRVVGVPGDRIVYRQKRLSINGQALTYAAMQDYRGEDYHARTEQFVEQLGGVRHRILHIDDRPAYVQGKVDFPDRDHCSYDAEGFSCTVPAGHYFMMGDSRDNSSDSRYWGFVPEENIIGKAFFIWMNLHQLKHIGMIR